MYDLRAGLWRRCLEPWSERNGLYCVRLRELCRGQLVRLLAVPCRPVVGGNFVGLHELRGRHLLNASRRNEHLRVPALQRGVRELDARRLDGICLCKLFAGILCFGRSCRLRGLSDGNLHHLSEQHLHCELHHVRAWFCWVRFWRGHDWCWWMQRVHAWHVFRCRGFELQRLRGGPGVQC